MCFLKIQYFISRELTFLKVLTILTGGTYILRKKPQGFVAI